MTLGFTWVLITSIVLNAVFGLGWSWRGWLLQSRDRTIDALNTVLDQYTAWRSQDATKLHHLQRELAETRRRLLDEIDAADELAAGAEMASLLDTPKGVRLTAGGRGEVWYPARSGRQRVGS